MSAFLIISVFVVGIPLNILSIWMKMRVNENLPEDRRLSWWSRNFRDVERIYGEQHPQSVLPDLSRYGSYLTIALLAAAVLVSFILGKTDR